MTLNNIAGFGVRIGMTITPEETCDRYPDRFNITRRALVLILVLLILTGCGLWGFSQCYSVNVKKSFLEIWVEAGCVVIGQSSPVLLPWSPSDAVPKAMTRGDTHFHFTAQPRIRQTLNTNLEWNSRIGLGHGFVLPSLHNYPRQADFALRVGWDRSLATVPLWLPIIISASGLYFLIKPSPHRQSPPGKITSKGIEPINMRRYLRSGLSMAFTLWVAVVAICTLTLGVASLLVENKSDANHLEMLKRILRETDPPPTDSSDSLGEPIISGSLVFMSKVRGALTLLKEKDPHGYRCVCKYAPHILESEDTHASVKLTPQRINLGKDEVESSQAYLAGAIVHEACHCKLYKRVATFGFFGIEGSAQTDEELACISEQATTLRLIGATNDTINYIERQDGQHWKHGTHHYDD